jgi:hypothetical protein
MPRSEVSYVKVNGSRYPGMNVNRELIIKDLAKHKDNIRDSLRRHGKEVKDELRKVIETSVGKGIKYASLPNRSSAPGDAPVSQSGRVASSFKYISRPMELVIGNEAKSDDGDPYPAFLEGGTSNMEPRPYFIDNIERLHGRLQEDLQNYDR